MPTPIIHPGETNLSAMPDVNIFIENRHQWASMHSLTSFQLDMHRIARSHEFFHFLFQVLDIISIQSCIIWHAVCPANHAKVREVGWTKIVLQPEPCSVQSNLAFASTSAGWSWQTSQNQQTRKETTTDNNSDKAPATSSS